MFIHWGVYSSTQAGTRLEAEVGYPEQIKALSYQQTWDQNPPCKASLASTWPPRKPSKPQLDATAWCQQAKGHRHEDAIITSKHHDGFAIGIRLTGRFTQTIPSHRDPIIRAVAGLPERSASSSASALLQHRLGEAAGGRWTNANTLDEGYGLHP